MDSTNLHETWQRICNQIKGYGTVNPLQVDAFFGRLQPQAIADGYIFITADTELIKSMVEKRFMPTLQQALKDLYGFDYLVEIEVDPSQAEAAPVAAPAPAPAVVAEAPVAAPVAASMAETPVQQPVEAAATPAPAAPDMGGMGGMY